MAKRQKVEENDCKPLLSLSSLPVVAVFFPFSSVARKAIFYHAFSPFCTARFSSPLRHAVSRVQEAPFCGSGNGDAWAEEVARRRRIREAEKREKRKKRNARPARRTKRAPAAAFVVVVVASSRFNPDLFFFFPFLFAFFSSPFAHPPLSPFSIPVLPLS